MTPGRPFPRELSAAGLTQDDLRRRYAEPHRHYHTLQHLERATTGA